ncbi:TPA: phage holin family protein [Clostridioides difficile]|uniref:phage holin family protein n=2 Tax=Clostridioides difficile TaxID=1496 RepID=UPI00038D64BC|nr:phage holin family protein [Clostridioides difficile]EQI78443.1 putative membrane protein [Clostridioides difficile Y401]MDL5066711.1 phage holin family protein [Clostridioides difficile]MDN9455622.1 phage holin family protein [Clostridioides difficile]HBF7900772.1 phage holin family protein [Clostridioides difficile]HCP7139070.1 phage holin family protein [Clostridioides difficile]
MDNLISFIPEQLLILVAALSIIGKGCKKYKQLDNKYIPIILLVLGIGFSIWMLGFSPNAVLQGIICWGISIGINQTYKQLKEENKQ